MPIADAHPILKSDPRFWGMLRHVGVAAIFTVLALPAPADATTPSYPLALTPQQFNALADTGTLSPAMKPWQYRPRLRRRLTSRRQPSTCHVAPTRSTQL